MKKTVIALLFILAGGLVFGHPPTVEKAVYDPATKLLTVTFSHNIKVSPVADVTKHYIKEVDISINGGKAVVQTLDRQETQDTEVLVYKVLVKSGDKVSVSGTCNLRGTGSKEILIP